MVVTWTTYNDTQESRVQYGELDMDEEAVGGSTLFTDGGKLRRTMWIHRTLLPDLKFNTKYGLPTPPLFCILVSDSVLIYD
ncbi:jg223 [Pararge aegeria aegeria]|uniref:Jg223 protein n=1 Tax=Pararge aegeria aegeria TaxID=348720 RepID=A0A8S4QCX1_9NEOP|nr:jg223 [Pararge aegeria aegeria]